MRQNKRAVIIWGLFFFLCLLLGFSIFWGTINGLPSIADFVANQRAYETRIAYRDNYKLHTTPMPNDIAKDVCDILEIEETSEHCQPDAVVYAPDFFDELIEYFNNLPEEERTYETVQKKLGMYLKFCGETSSDGNYRCRYDFIGDNKYSFFFYFDKNDYYFRIIANTGGS